MAFDRNIYNVCLKLSETWTLTVQFTEADGTTPIDLTGRVVRVQVREQANSTTTLLDLTEGSGLTVNPATGTVEINTPTTGITSTGKYVWALELGGSENEEPIGGQFTVDQDVVR